MLLCQKRPDFPDYLEFFWNAFGSGQRLRQRRSGREDHGVYAFCARGHRGLRNRSWRSGILTLACSEQHYADQRHWYQPPDPSAPLQSRHDLTPSNECDLKHSTTLDVSKSRQIQPIPACVDIQFIRRRPNLTWFRRSIVLGQARQYPDLRNACPGIFFGLIQRSPAPLHQYAFAARPDCHDNSTVDREAVSAFRKTKCCNSVCQRCQFVGNIRRNVLRHASTNRFH